MADRDWKISALLMGVMCVPCGAQMRVLDLPDAPSALHTRAWAINAGISSKYSFTKSTWDAVPRVGIDYRFTARVRVGLDYAHLVLTGENSVSAGVNCKLAEWGKVR